MKCCTSNDISESFGKVQIGERKRRRIKPPSSIWQRHFFRPKQFDFLNVFQNYLGNISYIGVELMKLLLQLRGKKKKMMPGE